MMIPEVEPQRSQRTKREDTEGRFPFASVISLLPFSVISVAVVRNYDLAFPYRSSTLSQFTTFHQAPR